MVFELNTKYTATVLAEFIAEHPELTLIHSSQELNPCWPEWEVNLTAKFTVNVQGADATMDCTLRVTWEECGDSQNEFEEFTTQPRYTITVDGDEKNRKKYCGICMMNKWHIVDDKSAEMIAHHFNQVDHSYKQKEQNYKIITGIKGFIMGVLLVCVFILMMVLINISVHSRET